MAKLTEAYVRDLRAPDRGETNAWDDQIKGLGMRVRAGRSKTWVVKYRTSDGRQRKRALGKWPTMSADEARRRAKKLLGEVAGGRDPAAEEDAERGAPTVLGLIDRFKAEHLGRRRPSTQRDYGRSLDRIAEKLGHKKITAVRHRDIETLFNEISRRAPIEANRFAAVASKLFGSAVRWEMRPDNPVRGIERNPEEHRQRFLSGEELGRLFAALAEHRNEVAANAIRLLALTGARRMEVLAATWHQFDLRAGVWTKPSSHTKQKREHRVPLSEPAVELLNRMREAAASNFLFPALTKTDHMMELKAIWAEVCARAGLEGARVHDLRHSYASILASAGMSLPLIGALLGHTQAQTTARYGHLLDSALRAATERVGAVVNAASSGNSEADFVAPPRTSPAEPN